MCAWCLMLFGEATNILRTTRLKPCCPPRPDRTRSCKQTVVFIEDIYLASASRMSTDIYECYIYNSWTSARARSIYVIKPTGCVPIHKWIGIIGLYSRRYLLTSFQAWLSHARTRMEYWSCVTRTYMLGDSLLPSRRHEWRHYYCIMTSLPRDGVSVRSFSIENCFAACNLSGAISSSLL